VPPNNLFPDKAGKTVAGAEPSSGSRSLLHPRPMRASGLQTLHLERHIMHLSPLPASLSVGASLSCNSGRHGIASAPLTLELLAQFAGVKGRCSTKAGAERLAASCSHYGEISGLGREDW
jgi:hypothetical protein